MEQQQLQEGDVPSATTTPTRQAIVLDALPYFDNVHEDYEAYALSLIEEEMKALSPPLLPNLAIPSSSSELRKHTMQELTVDRKRKIADYVTPSRSKLPSSKAANDWRLAVSHARSEHEAERIRSLVLEAEKSASGPQWQLWLEQMNTLEQDYSQRLDHQRSKVDDMNSVRQKQQQNETGQDLRILTTKWQERMHTKRQLVIANKELQAQVDALKQQTLDLTGDGKNEAKNAKESNEKQ